MSSLTEHYRFRDELTDRLRDDLLGPVGGPEEILSEEPATAYIAGILFPSFDAGTGSERNDEDDVDLAPSTLAVGEMPDTGVAMANRLAQSAMGMTFAVDPRLATALRVQVKAARYEPVNADGTPAEARRAERRSFDDTNTVLWRRIPLAGEPIPLAVGEPGDRTLPVGGVPGLELRARVRPPDPRGAVTVTLTLVNTGRVAPADLLDPHCFFQPELRVMADNGSAAFVERHEAAMATDDEILLSRLLYRHAPMFATGHGCSVDWNWTPFPVGEAHAGRAATDAIWTSVLPVRDVLLAEANPEVEVAGMHWLGTAPEAEVLDHLRSLVSGYETWIKGLERGTASFHSTEFDRVARDQARACGEAARRMAGGIALLETDRTAMEAFRLANRAMAVQRSRSAWLKDSKKGVPDLEGARWRAFQLGFVLLCLNGVADCGHPDREIADVLWFPTGGGKTEAYLGLIAFTTFLRRLRAGERSAGQTGGGVTVLMRYTLRLLTLQQFERAAMLICAMERMRHADPDRLGTERISIGMWVGRAATPNTLAETQESLRKLAQGKQLQEKNPVQLRSCPWCGTAMDYNDYRVDAVAGTMTISCRGRGCDFSATTLPVHVVDEDIYAVRPTLLIATADKFAQITWRANVAKLFNRAGAPEGTAPPELVIQDELHLISGPLGSLAGLYETAIDIAADRPKVIASTATIRRAEEQGTLLFDRTVRQFPPAGLDARDSWFAVEAPRDRKATRRYVGLLTSSTSQSTLLIRAYAALLHHALTGQTTDAVRDAYWTLIGYFNSLRLLSAAELQVHADVAERLKQLAVRDGRQHEREVVLSELTSRVPSSEIPNRLKELFLTYDSGSAIDVLLATNMISVGVDVDRLGLMTVMGQPQTTAEYIQATSRVGRRDPGLVVTLLNSTRSRDRSHYENFVSYHSALYRQVESTSVTPFSARTRDRALHAALVGLARVMLPDARPNDAATRIEDYLDDLEALKNMIVERIARTAPDEHEDASEELDEFIAGWRDLAVGGHLTYEAPYRVPGRRRDPSGALLRSYGEDEDLLEAADTMWSLRDVDVDCALFLER